MTQPAPLSLAELDPVLRQVLSDHSHKTLAWMRREPGAWGYLAGQGVAATRKSLGRQLTDPERRIARPRQVYRGPEVREFVPINKRLGEAQKAHA